MQYIFEYELCGLIFLFAVMGHFFNERQFPSRQNKMFGIILWCAVADIVLDMAGSYTIAYALVLPEWVNYLVNTVFYILQVIFPVFLLIYIMILTGLFVRKNAKIFVALCIPVAFFIILLIMNPYTKDIFYIHPRTGYTHGRLFSYLYLCPLFYMAVSVFIAERYRDGLKKDEFSTIIAFIFVVLAAIIIQFFYPPVLLTGFSIALSITMMYFTMQNPENMLDIMTGTFTYRAMILFLSQCIKEKTDFQIIATDVHEVRRINSLFGMQAGDDVLIEVGSFLSSQSDKIWVFRFMGTCFVAITTNIDDYNSLLESCKKRKKQPVYISEAEVTLPVTICAARETSFIRSPQEATALLEASFLEALKSNISEDVFMVDEKMLDNVNRHLSVENILRDSIDNGSGLEIFFQPMYSPKEQRFVSAEVLLRLNHPTLGKVSPGEFVPLAERRGLAIELDGFVIDKTFEFIKKYDPKNTLGVKSLEINFSATEFMDNRMHIRIMEFAEKHKIDPDIVMFEITETAATTEHGSLQGNMKLLCDEGFHFALDDFGTGYANLSQVMELPFHCVKLDSSLLKGSRILFEDSAKMLKRLGFLTIAEGVEEEAEIDIIKEIGIDYIQGFYYAKPMPASEFIEFMKKENNL